MYAGDTTMRFILVFLLSFGLTYFISSHSDAAEIKKVKGKKVLIDLKGMSAAKGEIFKVIGKNGKATGLVKILSVKNGKAVARLGKGKAEIGGDLKPRGSSKSKDKKKTDSYAGDNAPPRESKSAWGALIGFNQTAADILVGPGETRELKGNGFSLKGLFDYPLTDYLWFRGAAGYEQFATSSSYNQCGATTDQECKANINYLTFDFWGRITFGDEPRLWVGGGFDVLVPISKDSTALEENKITNTSLMAIGGGADIFINDTSYVPVQVEYGLYPKSNTVEATSMALRVGYAMTF
jgi:hypothetical protein